MPTLSRGKPSYRARRDDVLRPRQTIRVHQVVNEWVLSGARAQFPLLHHWRILPIVQDARDDRLSLAQWGGTKDNTTIGNRVSAITEAAASIVLFMECIPMTLGQWIGDQLQRATDPGALVLSIAKRLLALLMFIRENGLIHMDAHFDNILTDGRELYLGDYGLAISQHFEMLSEEREFLTRHHDFDVCTALTSLTRAVVTQYQHVGR